MKTLVPIAFCLNRSFLLLMKVALDSLLRSAHADTLYHVYIVSSDLTDQDRKSLDAIPDRLNTTCRIIHRSIDDDIFRERGYDPMHGSFSYYYRLALPLIVPEHDKIIYSDADVLFMGDMGRYNATPLGDSYLGVVQFDHPSYFTADYAFDGKYFASGNIIMNLAACRSMDMLSEIGKVARKYQGQLRHYDQDCLNAMFYDQVTYLPLNFCVNHKLYQDIARDRYYNIHLRNYPKVAISDAIEHPDIVHYTGPKPDRSSPSCKLWQLACARAGFIDEYVESVLAEREKGN